MKPRSLLLLLPLLILIACGPSGSDQVPVAELPNPSIYAISLSELPDVGLAWQQSYNQTTTQEGLKWSYLAYQAYQPGSLGVELESAFAVNNDIVLYSVDMRRAELPQPPLALGNIQNVSWKTVSAAKRFGDKSSVWKTTLGELLTPVWWLEFYQGHAYVRLSLFGFPDQVASSFLYGLGDIVASRLPRSVATLRADAATQVATQTALPTTLTPSVVPTVSSPQTAPTLSPVSSTGELTILGYNSPAGEVGMLSFLDDGGKQLTDGILGSDDILADLGSGSAYEWVGWTELTDPVTLTFSVESQVDIAAVQIGFNHRDGLGIFVPDSVTINGIAFPLDAEAVPNNQRADLTFTGPFQGPQVEIVLHHRGRGWILVDEVRFIPGQ